MLKQTNTDNWFFNFLCNSPPTSVYIELMFDTNHGCPITYWSIFENTHWHWYTNNLLGNQYLNRHLKLGYKTFTKTEEVWQRLEETIKALAGISQCLSMLMHVQKNDQQFINMPIQWFHQCLQKQDYWHTINLSAIGTGYSTGHGVDQPSIFPDHHRGSCLIFWLGEGADTVPVLK